MVEAFLMPVTGVQVGVQVAQGKAQEAGRGLRSLVARDGRVS